MTDRKLFTQNCPVGFRVVAPGVCRIVGAALSVTMMFMSVGFASAQGEPEKESSVLVLTGQSDTAIQLSVVDMANAVIPKAVVSIVNEAAIDNKPIGGTTDAMGKLYLPHLSAGSYVVTIRAVGFNDLKICWSMPVFLHDHEVVRLDAKLRTSQEVYGMDREEPPVRVDPAVLQELTKKIGQSDTAIQLSVVDMTGWMISKATVTLVNEAALDNKPITGTTDASGRLYLSHLSAGSYVVTISAIGFNAFKMPLALLDQEIVSLDIKLQFDLGLIEEVHAVAQGK